MRLTRLVDGWVLGVDEADTDERRRAEQVQNEMAGDGGGDELVDEADNEYRKRVLFLMKHSSEPS